MTINLRNFANATKLIEQHRIVTSLLVPGYLGLDSRPEIFRMLPRSVFLGSDRDYLSMSIDDETDQLLLGVTADPSFPATLLEEPTIRPGLLDLSIYYLKEMSPVELEEVCFYTDADSDPAVNRFRAILLRTEDSRSLLFDPYWPFGIKIGNENDVAELRAEAGQAVNTTEVGLL